MIISMILAHLIGDYVLQTDKIAKRKSESLYGVVLHCIVVAGITFLFVLPFSPIWWQGALFISISHFLIDAIQLPISKTFKSGRLPLIRFLIDQLLHFSVIVAALSIGGYINHAEIWSYLSAEVQRYPALIYILAYTILAMPAWVLLEFVGYGLVEGSPPNFAQATNKYTSSLERWLILTCVILGQYLLIPAVTVPKVFIEKRELQRNTGTNLYLIKYLASIGLALGIGLGLRLILPSF